MTSAKDIIVKPIKASAANELVKRVHYSGKVVQNSSLHFGAFLNNKLEGVMSFGPSMKKSGVIGLVSSTGWNGFIELNRMAFSDKLPRNSESRCIAVAFKLIRKHYPHIEWVISFSDGSQCGDGVIYRASGFVLTQIKENSQIRINPATGKPMQSMAAFHAGKAREFKNWEKITGYQLRYIYFLNKNARQRLTVPILPFSKIDEMGARMYKGIKRDTKANSGDHPESGGAVPTITLQSKGFI
jgi:hypothetical protein